MPRRNQPDLSQKVGKKKEKEDDFQQDRSLNGTLSIEERCDGRPTKDQLSIAKRVERPNSIVIPSHTPPFPKIETYRENFKHKKNSIVTEGGEGSRKGVAAAGSLEIRKALNSILEVPTLYWGKKDNRRRGGVYMGPLIEGGKAGGERREEKEGGRGREGGRVR